MIPREVPEAESMRPQSKIGQHAFECDADDEDLFGNDEDEDFDLFSTFKCPTKVDKPKSISTPVPPDQRRFSGNGGDYPLNERFIIPRSAVLFNNSGIQNTSGLVNLMGLTQGILNGSVILVQNNFISVHP